MVLIEAVASVSIYSLGGRFHGEISMYVNHNRISLLIERRRVSVFKSYYQSVSSSRRQMDIVSGSSPYGRPKFHHQTQGSTPAPSIE